MYARRWEPRSLWTEWNRLRDDVERVMGGSGLPHSSETAYPPLNLWEDDDNLYVEAELPGLDLDALDITVTGDRQLSLKGDRQQPDLKDGTWHRRERISGEFFRVVELPEAIDTGKVSAELKQGVLTLTLPRKEEAKARRIEVRTF